MAAYLPNCQKWRLRNNVFRLDSHALDIKVYDWKETTMNISFMVNEMQGRRLLPSVSGSNKKERLYSVPLLVLIEDQAQEKHQMLLSCLGGKDGVCVTYSSAIYSLLHT